ncbi:C-factor [Phytophthora nicotianae]|uniref:C-factor n=1 Tax=Phytophthora nicotianae TaxID=4792 RepID=A0A0W8D1H5_PHYNI|nr:C-factor [Phytophthora nicotianae]
MTKAQRKRAHARAEAARARELTNRYREDKASKVVTFDDVAELLDGPYSAMKAKAKIDAFDLPTVEIQGALSVRPKDVDQEVPVIKAIPQAPAIVAAIEKIKIKQDIDLLAYWPDYGYAIFDQLDTMASLLEARSRFSLVARTTEWIDGVEWCIADLREPLADTSNVTKVLCSQIYTEFTPKLTEAVVFAERAQVVCGSSEPQR